MPRKRGRPVSTDEPSPATQQRREAWRRHQQRKRIRTREAAHQATPTEAQREQGYALSHHPPMVVEAADPTLTALGLRVQGLTLAEDTEGARYEATARLPGGTFAEHRRLYKTQDAQFFRALNAWLQTEEREESSPTRSLDLSIHTTPSPPRLDTRSLAHRFTPARIRREMEEARPTPFISLTESVDDMSRPISTRSGGEEGSAGGEGGDTEDAPNQYAYTEESEAEDTPTLEAEVEDAPVLEAFAEEGCVEEAQVEDAPILEAHTEEAHTEEGHTEEAHAAEAHAEEAYAEEAHAEDAPTAEAHVEEGPTEDALAEELMVERLCAQLIDKFHGCERVEHQEDDATHARVVRPHFPLAEAGYQRGLPSTISSKALLTPEDLSGLELPGAATWEEIFCGTTGMPGSLGTPKNICLHEEEAPEVAPLVAFDIDSYLGFATSLAFAKKGLWMQLSPQMTQNITNDVHVEVYSIQEGAEGSRPSRIKSMIRDVPHFLLGRVEGAHDATVHILFPRLPVAGGNKFKSLSREQLERFMDRVCLPALHAVSPADYLQHLPGSFRNAEADTMAHHIEARVIETASYKARNAIGYHVQPGRLDALWQEMQRIVAREASVRDFEEMQLYFSAKNTKLTFKTDEARPLLLDAMAMFEDFVGATYNTDHVDLSRFYVDIGKEICAPTSRLARHAGIEEDSQLVYLRRRCCLKAYMRWMYDDEPPPPGPGQLYFHQNMLHDACSLTSVTPARSKQRAGGLVYSQMYASVKEIVDANKCFPFTNDGMEELALDPSIRRAARAAAGGRRRDGKIVEQAYLASKVRAHAAIQDSRGKSFGAREEHRITWGLFLGMRAWLALRGRDGQDASLTAQPSYVWAIRTGRYMDFLERSVNKFTTGFEVVRARSLGRYVSWEHTKIMCMFLRCLRFIFGGHLLSRESALWWSRRVRDVGGRERQWVGLGFSNTAHAYGYCWLEPRVDWASLQFYEDITDSVLFGNRMLRDQYLRRGGDVDDLFDASRQVDVVLGHMRRHPGSDAIRSRCLQWLVHICLRRFRRDVIESIKKAEFVEGCREEAVRGMRPFSFDYFSSILVQGPNLVSGNRLEHKDPVSLLAYLLDSDDGYARRHWEDKPYRATAARISGALRAVEPELRLHRAFRRILEWQLLDSHWLLPYPSPEGLTQTTKQGRRMWYSIKPSTKKGWQWARLAWTPGEPRALPEWLTWTKEQWNEWFDARAAT